MRTALICTEEPDPFVVLADAKKQLRVTSTTDDDTITALIACACAFLEGADGALKRAIATQTWKLVLPRFSEYRHRHVRFLDHLRGDPARHPYAVKIPLPPIQSVSEIKYFDIDGNEQTLATDQYRLVNCGTDPSFVIPTTCWPAIAYQPDAVSVTFAAGYEDDKIPTVIKQAVFLMVRQLYDMGARSVFISGETVFGVGSKSYSVSAAAAQVCQGVVDRLLFNSRILRG